MICECNRLTVGLVDGCLPVASNPVVIPGPAGKGIEAVFRLAVDPFGKSLLGAGFPAGHGAIEAGIIIGRAGGWQVGIDKHDPQPLMRTELRCDQQVVFADAGQAGQNGGILHVYASAINVIRQFDAVDSQGRFKPNRKLIDYRHEQLIADRVAGGRA